MLSEKYNLKYLSSHSACPHITISSGKCVSRERFKKAVYSCLPHCRPITIKSNGIGIFVKEAPVIYIRWFLSKELNELCLLIQKRLRNVWSETDKSSSREVWMPKSTLALKDTCYDQLPLVLGDLNVYNFKQGMVVDKLTLIEMESKEIVIEEISFN